MKSKKNTHSHGSVIPAYERESRPALPGTAIKLLVIVGPTASGKSDLAVQMARQYNGEVISADSRQVYKGLDIGSGKITKKEMRGIRHHLLDVASPKNTFTVARYQKLARKALADILRRGKLPIITGGTGFYIDSILYDTTIPEVKPSPKLRAELEKHTASELFLKLKKKDPARAANIDPHNKRRLIRALEIIATTGKPVPQESAKTHAVFLGKLGITGKNIKKIGITRSPEELRNRINARLLKRLRQGMLREVQRLHNAGVSWKRLDDFGLEYRYASRYLRGLITKEEMVTRIEKESWHYARRQMTWWKKDKGIRWEHPS